MEKVKFNHDAEGSAEACGLNFEEFQTKFKDVVDNKIKKDDDIQSMSQITEVLEDNFNKRELAFICSKKMLREAKEVSQSRDPLVRLLEALEEDK